MNFRVPVLACALVLVALSDARPPARAGEPAPVPGLSAEVHVVTDPWGVPHIRAASLPDLYYAWGWVTARDRLWQLVLTRASAQGRAHRLLGNSALQADGGAQLFRLRERADALWARDARDPALRIAVERFTDGINARLRECREGRAPWPPELVALHARPEDWRPADCEVLLLGLGVTLDLDLPELGEAAALRAHGRAWFEARHRFEARWVFDTIADSTAGTTRPGAARRDASLEAAPSSPLAAAVAADAEEAASRFRVREADGGDRASNEMVVGPGRAARGRPLLANDPHLGLTAPGAFHVVHLSVPGVLEAAGATIPGLPAIVSGRSTRCAWGVTALGADVIDVYADTISADGKRVRGPDGWVPVVSAPFDLSYRVLGIPLPVPGKERRYTPHGPVLSWDPAHHVALSARWSAMEDSRITMASLVGVERSRGAAEIAARFRTLVTPTINLVAADVAGGTIYQACGLVPRRPSDPGPGVLPGDGRHEWPGFIPADSMPAWRPPADGFAVNGNNRPVHSRSPYAWPRYTFPQDRAARMAQRLGGDRSLTVADMMSVQNDVASRAAARQLPALLAAVAPLSGRLPARERAALDTLRAWDGAMRRSRVAPTLARSWWSAYVRRARLESLQGLALATLTGEAPDTLTFRGARESRTASAAGALATALDTLGAKLGPDLARWTWGRAHRARFAHPLARRGDGARFEPPLTPEDGDGSTICVGGSRAPWNFDVGFGPAFRHVVDLADSLTSWMIVPPWNAADGNGHSTDLRGRWASHDYVPLRMDWALIEREGAARVTLSPGGPAPR
jgi:penicillin amidase